MSEVDFATFLKKEQGMRQATDTEIAAAWTQAADGASSLGVHGFSRWAALHSKPGGAGGAASER